MSTNKSDIRLIQLNNYVRPEVKEYKSKGYVLNGSIRDDFYNTIISRYNGSPTNATIINSFINLTYGQGLYSKRADRNMSDWGEFVQACNPKEVRKIVADYKMFGEFSFQVIEKRNGKLESIKHIPKNKVMPSIENEDEEIESYWYSRNWKKLNEFPAEEIPAFNGEGKQPISIYVGKPYKAGKEYFADPDYIAGLPYAEMEEEIANYYVSHIKNGLSFGYIINVPDGMQLTPEEKDDIERKIKTKLTGSSNAGKFIISFNGGDKKIEVEVIQVNDAHKQWQYLTEESRQQLLTAHQVVSPMLFGIKDSTGLGNNANELDEAEAQLMKRVIRPYQLFILDGFKEVLSKYNINLDLDFRPLTEQAEVPETTVRMSEQLQLDDLGEKINPDEYELVDEIEVDYEEEQKVFLKLASTGTARPNARSSQDGENFIVRYAYTGNQTPEREFCRKMMAADKVYRKEDIIRMGNMVVNAGWGPEGADTYSIWLYKGGKNCYHQWFRRIYLKKGSSVDVNSPLAEIISTSEARRRGMKLETNDTLVSVKPINMPNQGGLPSNPQ